MKAGVAQSTHAFIIPERRPEDGYRDDEEQQRPDDQRRDEPLALALKAHEQLG